MDKHWPIDRWGAKEYYANADALSRCAPDALYQPSAHPLLFKVGYTLARFKDWGDAREYYQQLADNLGRLLGRDHADTLTARHFLAVWRRATGDADGAMTALLDLAAHDLRALGADHPETIATRADLANWRKQLDSAGGAAAVYAELLLDQNQALGADDPRTLDMLDRLSRWFGDTHHVEDATYVRTELLARQLRRYGAQDRHVLESREYLADLWGQLNTKDIPGAVEALADVLVDCLRILGPDHEQTRSVRGTLHRWCTSISSDHRGLLYTDPGATAAAYARICDAHIHILGPDHPDTLGVSLDISDLRKSSGHPDEASTMLNELLEHQLRTVGPDHANTLRVRDRLANALWDAGETEAALDNHAELLASRVRTLGPDHPDTVRARDTLARLTGTESGVQE